MRLVPLGQPHLSYDQYQTSLGTRVDPGLGVVVIKSPVLDQIQILPSSAHGWYQITALTWHCGCRFPHLPSSDSFHVPHILWGYLKYL